MQNKVEQFSLITSDDAYLFKHRNHFRLYEKMGSRLIVKDGIEGAYFCVWAPNASSVSVIGEFNDWHPLSHQLFCHGANSGIWEGFISGIAKGDIYKYLINSSFGDLIRKKADPFAIYSEAPQKTSSKVWDLGYEWNDKSWMGSRKLKSLQNAPVSILEVHLNSWHKQKNFSSYAEIAKSLANYCNDMGFTHIEILPITQNLYDISCGYQTSGFFAANSSFGTPQDLMSLIDILHQANIAVILDWAPSCFPIDTYTLSHFDGTALYEYADKKMSAHTAWNVAVFDYSKTEVQNFLISSALFWLDKYHIDGIKVDDVTSMLYLANKDGQISNKFGGKENIDAIDFLRKLNSAIYENFDGIQTYAQDGSNWANVSKPIYLGGLGFGFKWNMAWVENVLNFVKLDNLNKPSSYSEFLKTFSYAFSENFLLPFSHNQVEGEQGNLINQVNATNLGKFDAIRLILGYAFAYPGKKLLFMGDEFESAQPQYKGIQKWIQDLNKVYKQTLPLYDGECEILIGNDEQNSVLAFLRKSSKTDDIILCVFNFMPFVRHEYKIGVDYSGRWDEILNSDAREYFGQGIGNFGFKNTQNFRIQDKPYCLEISIPPLSAVFFKHTKTFLSSLPEIPTPIQIHPPQPDQHTGDDFVDKICNIDGLKPPQT
jgi:1,4-alpha-glucan branching enzyme